MQDDIVIDENGSSEAESPQSGEVNFMDRVKDLIRDIGMKWSGLLVWQRTAIIVAVLAIVGSGVWWGVTGSGSYTEEEKGSQLTSKNSLDIEIDDPGESKDQVAPLNGELVTKTEYAKLAEKKPLAVVVENHPDARMQSGLDKADIVYESLVEGGITRFVPVFYTQEPEVVGPVRSVRKYFLDFIAGLDDPLIMHIGGATSSNPEANALGEVQRYGMKSMGVSGGEFWRVSDKAAPHNAYTNTKTIWAQADGYGWTGPNSIYTWEFKDPVREISNAEIKRIEVDWGGWGKNTWTVVWEFDPTENVYKRFHLNEVHRDAVTQKQLVTKNVIVVLAPYYSANDGTARIVYDVIGNGRAKVFRDGKVIEAVWNKPTRTDRFMFKDEGGRDIVFNRGQSWIMVAPVGSVIEY